MNPRIKPHLTLVAHRADLVEVRAGGWHARGWMIAEDAIGEKLLPLLRSLDGTLSLAELSTREGVDRSVVEDLVGRLQREGIVEAAPGSALDHFLAVVSPRLRGLMPTPPPARPVLLLGDVTLTDRIAALLTETAPHAHVTPVGRAAWSSAAAVDPRAGGLALERSMEPFEGWRGALVVLALGAVDPLAAAGLNRAALHVGFAFLHAVIDGPWLLVGPTVLPPFTPCYACLEERVLGGLRDGGSYLAYKEALALGRTSGGAPPLQPLLEALLATHTAMEVVNVLTTGSTFSCGKVLGLHLPTAEFAWHDVPRVAGCPACAPSDDRERRELHFEARALTDELP